MDWLWVLVWGGLVGLDATSFPQAMIARPFPAAALLGLMLGEPLAGALIGALVEIFALASLPIGAARYPDSGTAAVAAAGAYITVAGPGIELPLILVALLFTLGWERVGEVSVNLLRRLNERVAAVPVEQAEVDPAWVTRRHLFALAMDFARAAVVALAGWTAGVVLLGLVRPHWTIGPDLVLGALVIALSGMLAGSLAIFGGLSERRAVFFLGLACGMALLFVR